MSHQRWLLVAIARLILPLPPSCGQPLTDLLFFENKAGYTSLARDVRTHFLPSRAIYRIGDHELQLEFQDANQNAYPVGEGRQSAVVNYLVGNQPQDWLINRATYSRVAYYNIYPGIAARFGFSGSRLKSEFVVAPGGDPHRIRLRYTGLGSPQIDRQGDLVFTSQQGEFREQAPDAYQIRGSTRVEVPVRFVIRSDGAISFELGAFDATRPLTIDPTVVCSSYYGGHGDTAATAVATDSSGNVYVTGWTDSLDLPLAGAMQSTNAGSVDAFVLKLNSSGNTLLYATYIGGSGDDRGYGIAVDGSGNAYVTGSTTSSNFPVRSPIQSSLSGPRDAFVLKLNAAGNGLIFSTYLGGSGSETGYGIALDSQGNVYVAGDTNSSNFPVLNPFQASNSGGQDAFVTKISPQGQLSYSTYLGGSADDHAAGIAVDPAGNAYITGGTFSENFPTANAFQPANAGGQDVFVTKLNPAGNGLVYSTYIGGSGGALGAPECGSGIGVDQQGHAFVTGTTSSMNFPVTAAFQPAPGGGTTNAFIVELNPFGTGLLYGTYFGGSSMDYGQAIAVDSSGNAYVAGYTASLDLPLASPVQASLAGAYDAFVLELSSSGNALNFATYYGGSGLDAANGIALDPQGQLWVVGQTTSADFPIANALQSSMLGSLEAFVLKLNPVTAQPDFSLNLTPAAATVAAGASVTYSTSIAAANGFSGTVNLSVSNLPAGVTGSFNPASVAGSGSSILTINASASAAVGTYTVTATGTSGSITHNASASLTVTASAPPTVIRPVSVAPNSGSGSSVTLSEVYSDTAGGADITKVYTFLRSSYASYPVSGACYVLWDKASGDVFLANDAGTAWQGPELMSQAGTLSNSQCTVDLGASSVSISGNNLTLNLAFTFTSSFVGTEQIWMCANNTAVASSWVQEGSWTVPGKSTPPASGSQISAVSVTPNSGTGTGVTLSEVYSDTAGGNDITKVYTFLRGSYANYPVSGACYLLWDKATNDVFLANDAGTAWLGPMLMAQTGTISNSQCTLNLGASSIFVSGNNLTLNLALTFTSSFSGTQQIWMCANNATANGSWAQEGTWTVPAASTPPPAGTQITAVSVTPNTGTGASVTLAELYSDTSGGSDITKVYTLLRGSYTSYPVTGACYLLWDKATSDVFLANDAGTAWLGPMPMAQAGTLSNSQCTLNLGSSSTSVSGNNLTLNLALTFTSSFAGTQQIWMYANNATVGSGWVERGTWTVGAGTAATPTSITPFITPVSVTPNGGTGRSVTLAEVYSDTAGGADIAKVYTFLHSSYTAYPFSGACYLLWDKATNEAFLANDAGTAWQAPLLMGQPGTLSNSQCSLNLGASSVLVSGNNLTLNLALTFTTAFAGTQQIWMFANDTSVSSSWLEAGTFTVQ